AVDHACLQRVLQGSLLSRLKLVVDDEHLGTGVPVGALQLVELSLPEVRPALRPGAVLDHLSDGFDEGRSRKLTQLGELRFGIDSLGQHGGDEPALRRGIRLAWDHTTDYAGRNP